MKILAIDSSGLAASVAIASEDKIIAEYSVNYKKTHSQTLLPMLDEICRMVQLDLNEIDAIALANGPGSFTGLRIGTATAKGLGLALGKPLIPVPTLEGLAWNAWGASELVCPMMDARRNQVYTGIYRFASEPGEEAQPPQVVAEPGAMAVEEIAERINDAKSPVLILGDGADAYRESLRGLIKVPFRFAPAHMNAQRAGALAMCAFTFAKRGMMQDAASNRPDYLRVSQAERERAEKVAACTFRRMKPEDLDEVAVIEGALFTGGDAWSRGAFADSLGSADTIYAVAETGGKVIGYCGLLRSFDEADITNVAVSYAWQRQGIGRRMLKWLINEGESEGIENYTLEVRAGNEPAIALYEKLGFDFEGIRPGFYSNPKEDARIYWRRKNG